MTQHRRSCLTYKACFLCVPVYSYSMMCCVYIPFLVDDTSIYISNTDYQRAQLRRQSSSIHPYIRYNVVPPPTSLRSLLSFSPSLLLSFCLCLCPCPCLCVSPRLNDARQVRTECVKAPCSDGSLRWHLPFRMPLLHNYPNLNSYLSTSTRVPFFLLQPNHKARRDLGDLHQNRILENSETGKPNSHKKT